MARPKSHKYRFTFQVENRGLMRKNEERDQKEVLVGHARGAQRSNGNSRLSLGEKTALGCPIEGKEKEKKKSRRRGLALKRVTHKTISSD